MATARRGSAKRLGSGDVPVAERAGLAGSIGAGPATD
jgi:hypothetical protein